MMNIAELYWPVDGELQERCLLCAIPDSKVHGANMGPIWGRQDPCWPHVSPMNFVIWDTVCVYTIEAEWRIHVSAA